MAKKDISARYAQSAYLEAGHDIVVNTQILHCHAKAGRGVYVGSKNQKKSKLVGGIIKAGKEVFAGEIGSLANATVVLDFSHKLQALTAEYRQAKSEYDVKKELVGTIDLVREELVNLNLQHQSLNLQLTKLKEGIRVVIYGRIYPGVNMILDEQHYSIQEERGNSILRFGEKGIEFE